MWLAVCVPILVTSGRLGSAAVALASGVRLRDGRRRCGRARVWWLVRGGHCIRGGGEGIGGHQRGGVGFRLPCRRSVSLSPSPPPAWPVYCVAQDTMFWPLFVLRHNWCACELAISLSVDGCCRSGLVSFQQRQTEHRQQTHPPLLRISHWTHHQNHGHIEKDESWYPLPQKLYRSLDSATRKLRFALPFPMLVGRAVQGSQDRSYTRAAICSS